MNTTAMDKPARRLNGWERIGVAASVLWAAAVSFYALINYAGLDMAEDVESAVAFVFIPIPLGWILAYIVVGVVR